MNNRETTSEEKLLKLIRKEDREKNAKKHDDSSFKSDKVEPAVKIINSQRLKPINRLLIISLVLISAYLVYYVLNPQSQLSSSTGTNFDKDADNLDFRPPSQTGPFEATQVILAERDLFESPWEKPTDIESAGQMGGELSDQLQLIGILLDQDPKAVVFQLSTKETSFLSKGDKISDAVLDEILEDRVIFIYNEEKVEMKP